MICKEEIEYLATLSQLEGIYDLEPAPGDNYVDRAYRIYTHVRDDATKVSELGDHPTVRQAMVSSALSSLQSSAIIQGMKDTGLI